MERSIDNKSRKEGTRKRYGRREREREKEKEKGESESNRGKEKEEILGWEKEMEGRVLLYSILKYFLIFLSATDCDVTL